MTALRAAHAAFVSPGLVTLPDDALGFSRGAVLRDRDGHDLAITDAPAERTAQGDVR